MYRGHGRRSQKGPRRTRLSRVETRVKGPRLSPLYHHHLFSISIHVKSKYLNAFTRSFESMENTIRVNSARLGDFVGRDVRLVGKLKHVSKRSVLTYYNGLSEATGLAER